MIITVWERYDDEKAVWKFNHISEGYDATVAAPDSNALLARRIVEDPATDPLWFKGQARMWKSAKWRSHAATFVNNVVIEDDTQIARVVELVVTPDSKSGA